MLTNVSKYFIIIIYCLDNKHLYLYANIIYVTKRSSVGIRYQHTHTHSVTVYVTHRERHITFSEHVFYAKC